ncbi:MAG: hypothetical protein SGPRY_006882, partial [Prymnesium sp.]
MVLIGGEEGWVKAPPTAAETEALLSELLLASHKQLLRRRGLQSWRLHLLRLDLTSRCAGVWRVSPSPSLHPSLHDASVRAQLRSLAVVSLCTLPFHAWAGLACRSHRQAIERLRPHVASSLRLARATASRLSLAETRHSKLDRWITRLADRQHVLHCWRRWREASVLYLRGRALLHSRLSHLLGCWRHARLRLSLLRLSNGRHRLLRRGMAALARCRAAAAVQERVVVELTSACTSSAMMRWLTSAGASMRRREMGRLAMRRGRRRELRSCLACWRERACVTIRAVRAREAARAHELYSQLWAARVKLAIRALHPRREVSEAEVFNLLQDLGGESTGGELFLRRKLAERERQVHAQLTPTLITPVVLHLTLDPPIIRHVCGN